MKSAKIKELSLPEQEELAKTYLFQKVMKTSKKPFKSGLVVNTVKGFEKMHNLSVIRGKPVIGLTFYEDASVVEISILKIIGGE